MATPKREKSQIQFYKWWWLTFLHSICFWGLLSIYYLYPKVGWQMRRWPRSVDPSFHEIRPRMRPTPIHLPGFWFCCTTWKPSGNESKPLKLPIWVGNFNIQLYHPGSRGLWPVTILGFWVGVGMLQGWQVTTTSASSLGMSYRRRSPALKTSRVPSGSATISILGRKWGIGKSCSILYCLFVPNIGKKHKVRDDRNFFPIFRACFFRAARSPSSLFSSIWINYNETLW